MRAWVAGGLMMLGLVACGGSKPEIQTGPMPEGGTFTGVYFSPQYGEMHMVQEGSHVRGRYEKDERTGKILGEADGNVMTFEWTEEKAMIANRPQVTEGHGYFRYVVDPGNGEHKLIGRWGLGDDDREGGPWNAYKSKSREPELSAEGAGESETEGGEYYDDDLGAEGADDELF